MNTTEPLYSSCIYRTKYLTETKTIWRKPEARNLWNATSGAQGCSELPHSTVIYVLPCKCFGQHYAETVPKLLRMQGKNDHGRNLWASPWKWKTWAELPGIGTVSCHFLAINYPAGSPVPFYPVAWILFTFSRRPPSSTFLKVEPQRVTEEHVRALLCRSHLPERLSPLLQTRMFNVNWR